MNIKGPLKIRWIGYILVFFTMVFGWQELVRPLSTEASSFGVGCLILIFGFELLRDVYLGIRYGRGAIERLIDYLDLGFKVNGKKFLIEDHPIKLRIILNLPTLIIAMMLAYIGLGLILINGAIIFGHNIPSQFNPLANKTIKISFSI